MEDGIDRRKVEDERHSRLLKFSLDLFDVCRMVVNQKGMELHDDVISGREVAQELRAAREEGGRIIWIVPRGGIEEGFFLQDRFFPRAAAARDGRKMAGALGSRDIDNCRF